jgi:ribosomal-protein-alanine N-acetyltransferase
MIETNRLIIKPLNHKQLQAYIKLDNSLENSLKLNPAKREITPDLMEVLEYSILPNVENPLKNHLFFTLWTVIWKKNNCLVGDLCFVGEPNELGEVELGYGTYENFRNQGFMTEAVMGLVNWIKPYVNAILASCEKDNLPSAKILEKNGFVVCGHENHLIHWRLDIQK